MALLLSSFNAWVDPSDVCWYYRRATMAKEVARLKEEADLLRQSKLRWFFFFPLIECSLLGFLRLSLDGNQCLNNIVLFFLFFFHCFWCSDCPEAISPGARNSRIFALENMLATSSSTLVSMASQLSEAEERERGFSGRGRWNQVRSLADAKNIMNYLFNLASSSR